LEDHQDLTQVNMIAPTERFIGMRRKFPHGGLGKKMPTKEVANTMVMWSNTSSNVEHTNYVLFKRHQIEATIKEKMLENILNDKVDNEDVEMPYFLPAIEGGVMDTRGRVVDPPWMKACQTRKPL
jgi:hypothetical protein